MSNTVISVEHLTKRYDLGVVGTGTIARDMTRWWAHLRHQPDPETRVGQENDYNRQGESILALDDISFTVQQSETLGIIGRNGAGKSTLLKILSRVTAPTSGVVKVKGRIGSLLEVGTGFHPELTGRENVFLNGAILGMKKAEVQRKFDEIVDFSGVEKFIDTPVKRYSSGMHVRLGFAVAAHLNPDILIIDEVLAVGDVEFQKKCLGKMDEASQGGRTIFFVSHNMGMVRNLCSKVILLENGHIISQADSEETIKKYLRRIRSTESDDWRMSLDKSSWKTNVVVIENVEMLQDGEKVSGVVDAAKHLDVKISYSLFKDIVPFRVKLRLLSNDGIVFHTDDTFGHQTREFREKGKYISSCRIPAALLNIKNYKIEIGIDEPSIQILIPFTNFYSFSVIDTSGIIKYQSNWPGAIRPALEWSCEKNA